MERTLEELERDFPGLPWAEPVKVVIAGTGKGWACRVCIANRGMKAVDGLPFSTEQAARDHIASDHRSST